MPPGDSFGFAGEVVVIRARRYAYLGSDVLDEHAVKAALDRQPQGGPAQRLPGLLLLALPQAQACGLRRVHARTLTLNMRVTQYSVTRIIEAESRRDRIPCSPLPRIQERHSRGPPSRIREPSPIA